MAERSGKAPQPDADDERIAGSPAPPGGAVPAAEHAGAMGNQAFGRALEAARGADEDRLARFPAVFQRPSAPAIPAAASQGAVGAWDLGGRIRGAAESAAEGVVEGAQETAGAAIDMVALAGRVGAIARDALTMWTATSSIVGVTVNGPIGLGGALVGAPLMPFMQAGSAPPPAEAAVQAKALQGFADAFQQWCSRFSVPGTLLWPAFAAFPAPQAPPTPAIPMPLATLAPHPLQLVLAGSDEREQMALDQAAGALRAAFAAWVTGKKVGVLLGHGPVPSFAPPYVPVGPVHGTAFATPGVI